MKTLKVWMVVTVMLAICAPSFGYVLVYNTISRIKAIDSVAETITRVAVRGYLVLDINDANGDVNDAYWLLYGKDNYGDKVYTVEGLDPVMTIEGTYASIYATTGGGWIATVVGKRTYKDIGVAAGKQVIAYSLSGNFIIEEGGAVINMDQFLTGSGAMGVTLNSIKTKAANLASASVDDTLTTLTDALDTLLYTPL
jgi:hypothetical protein